MILAFDTSNYTTSIAILDGSTVVVDQRQLIDVKLGERGIRQSDGFFKHMQVLDTWINSELEQCINQLSAVAVSNKPRPIDGSYMPVFKAGEIVATAIAKSKGLPLYRCSHQEGHLFSALQEKSITAPFLFLHLSGGTTEIHRIDLDNSLYNFELISKTADISFGQLVDRIGVKSGLKFPCGAEMDRLAQKSEGMIAPRFKMKSVFNLSGYENYFSRCLEKYNAPNVYYHLFAVLANIIIEIVEHAVAQSKTTTVLIAGGVAENSVIRNQLLSWADGKQVNINFAKAHYASDNAVGVARYAQFVIAKE